MANLIDVSKRFGTDEACLDYIASMRWPGGVACLKCGSMKVAKTSSTVKNRRTGAVVKTRHLYQCNEQECAFQFSATAGTVFHDSHLPLPKWFMAIALLCDAKKSVSAMQLQRHLGIGSYRTAWYLNHRIREAMKQEGGIMGGTVEFDETFIGGKYDPRGRRRKGEKAPVAGVMKRADGNERSRVRVAPIRHSNKAALDPFVRANVSEDARLFTDDSRTYKFLDGDYLRYVVNHIAGEYVRGDIHTNGIEGFWSLVKRGIVGSYHQVSVKHLHRYLNEFAHRHNLRGIDLFQRTVQGLARTGNLTYADLIAEPTS